MGVCISRSSDESELAKQVLGSAKADAKTVRRLSALGVVDGEVWVTRQTSDIRKVFKFGAQLNKGQFGTIHVVSNSEGEKFACKQISKRKLVGPTSIRDVRREIEIMHHLRGHPNVINFHGAYEDSNDVYLVMELCTGGDLFERIEKITTITERAAASMFRELVETVSYCHTLGVVHRDLKPENFLITDRGPNSRIKLADFGLSCFYQEGQGDMHDIVGSAYYMAPEVIRRQYGASCDTWSLGIILHILLSGSPPFTGSSDADILRAVRTKEVDLTLAPWPSISRHARHLVSKMLEKDPAKRIRLEQVLSHPWLRPDGTASPRAIQGGLRDRILQFRALNTFKREARRVLAAALPAEEVSGLKLLFENLDTDHDGLLSVDELREGLAQRGEELPDADVRELLKMADLNSDGFLDYREFVAATYTLSRMQRNQVLLKAFRHFDIDGDGYITREELSSVLASVPLPSPGSKGGGRERESVSQLMLEADLDRDGRVDYGEFCAMMLAAGAIPEGEGGPEEEVDADGLAKAVKKAEALVETAEGSEQLVEPANLPGVVDEAVPRGGSSFARRRDLAGAVDVTADGSTSGAAAAARRALSTTNSRRALGSPSAVGSTSRGGGSTRGVSINGAAAQGGAGGGGLSRRPSQPSPVVLPSSASGPPPLASRGSGSTHGVSKTGPGWSQIPTAQSDTGGVPPRVAVAGASAVAGGDDLASDGSDDDGTGSQDSVIMAARRAPYQVYGEASVRNGVPRSGRVVVSER